MIRTIALLLSLIFPVYNANPPPLLQPGDQSFTVWSAETPTPGTGTTAASQQVALQIGRGDGLAPFAIDGKFSGDPGVFEVDIQVAATDADANYQTCSNCNITAIDATNFTFHWDVWANKGRFTRLLMRSRANSVTITATVTR